MRRDEQLDNLIRENQELSTKLEVYRTSAFDLQAKLRTADLQIEELRKLRIAGMEVGPLYDEWKVRSAPWTDEQKRALEDVADALKSAYEKPKCVCGGVGLGVACEPGCPAYIERQSCTCPETKLHGGESAICPWCIARRNDPAPKKTCTCGSKTFILALHNTGCPVRG